MPKSQHPISNTQGEAAWFAWDWNTPNFDAAALAACGITSVIAVAVPIHFDPQNRRLSLDEVRAVAQQIKDHAGPLGVWLSFNTVAQNPPRTLCRPKDLAARTQLLDNYVLIGRVCREFGFSLALNSEDMAGGPLSWPDEPGSHDLGADLARACRRDNAALRLAAYGPLAGAPVGFRKVWRGFADGAAATGEKLTFWDEGSYGLNQVDPKRTLRGIESFFTVNGKVLVCPGLGWDFAGKVPTERVADYIASAGAKVQAARRAGVDVMLYREGPMADVARGALGKVLNSP